MYFGGYMNLQKYHLISLQSAQSRLIIKLWYVSYIIAENVTLAQENMLSG